MALNVFELFGKIIVDHSGAKKGIDKTVKHAQDAESKLAKTFKKVGTMVAAAFSVRAIVDFGKQCTEAYASIAAEESAFAQIMGDYADTAHAKLNAVSDATGVSATRMTGAMTSLTAKFKGLGYDVEDATTLAADGLLIASDAAAFWDMSLDESMSHLNSFINGSYEGGEAIGLFANDTQMAAYAIEQGIVKDAKAWAKLDEAQRQATRLAYAKQMMESSGATGQAAKEADQYANVMANLKESWRQFQGVIGKPILEKIVLPAMQKLNAFMPKLTEAVQVGIEWLDAGFGKIKEYFADVFTEDGIKWDALPDALSKTFKGIERKVGGWLSGVGQKVQNSWNTTVLPSIKSLASSFGIELPDVDLGSIFASFNTAYESVKTTASKFYTNIKDAFAKDADGKVHLDKALSDLFKAGVDARAVLLTTAGTLIADIYGKITGDTENAEKIKTTLSGLFESGSAATSALIDAAGGLMGEIYKGITGEEMTTESIMGKVKGLFSVGSEALFDLTEGATGLMNNLASVIGDDTMGAGEKVAAIFHEGANAMSGLLKGAGTLLSDIYYEITSDQKGAVQLATLFSELFAPPETWKERMEKAGELFTAETFLGFVDDKANERYAMYYRNMIGSMLAGGVIGETQYDTWLNALNPNAKGWSATTKAIESLYWSAENNLPWDQRKGIYNGRYVDNAADASAGLGMVISAAIQSALATLPAEIKEAAAAGVAEGVGNMTITGHVTTGNVTLDGNALVGKLTPSINLALGSTMARYAMRYEKP